jgi:hypothetical protein
MQVEYSLPSTNSDRRPGGFRASAPAPAAFCRVYKEGPTPAVQPSGSLAGALLLVGESHGLAEAHRAGLRQHVQDRQVIQ